MTDRTATQIVEDRRRLTAALAHAINDITVAINGITNQAGDPKSFIRMARQRLQQIEDNWNVDWYSD